jgi:hypothetical protein
MEKTFFTYLDFFILIIFLVNKFSQNKGEFFNLGSVT